MNDGTTSLDVGLDNGGYAANTYYLCHISGGLDANRDVGRNAIHATASFDDIGGVEGVPCQQLVLLKSLGNNRVAQQVADDVRNLAGQIQDRLCIV